MEELRDEVFKKERKKIAKRIIGFIPPKIRSLIYLALCFYAGFSSRPFIEQHIHLRDINLSQLGIVNIYKEGEQEVKGTETSASEDSKDDCAYKYCSDFKDEKWEYQERFTKIQEDPLILKSPNTRSLPGATMFFNQGVGNFTMVAYITPMASNSANIAIAYGHFLRCILGDGDYSKISCQINTIYPKKTEDWSYIDSNGELHGRNQQYQKSNFSKDNELQVRFSMLKINNRTQVEIKINDQVPLSWFLPEEFEDKTQIEKVGIGLFTTGGQDVEAVFKYFQLDPHI